MKPILFSTQMVNAILDGRKTMTRRVIKQAKGWDHNWRCEEYTRSTTLELSDNEKLLYSGKYTMRCGSQYSLPLFKPKYSVGDILWVRETWANLNVDFKDVDPYYVYKADLFHPDQHGPVTWKPSIHMRKETCRIFLKVTGVRAEKLGDISEDDARSEGVLEFTDGTYKNYFTKKGLKESDGVECLSAVASFQSLWHSINKEWNPDQWVWVYTFKQIDKPANF